MSALGIPELRKEERLPLGVIFDLSRVAYGSGLHPITDISLYRSERRSGLINKLMRHGRQQPYSVTPSAMASGVGEIFRLSVLGGLEIHEELEASWPQ